jgi:trigger factor
VNVTIENLAPCKKLVRVEIEPAKVEETFATVTKEFRREANLPGFRPGKAPEPMVVRKYGKDIEAEVKRKLLSETYKEAIKEQKLEVIGYPDIEEIQFGRGQALQYAATVETAPEFELPEYKGIPVKREARKVTDEDVERAVTVLRTERATFNTVARPVQRGDIVVLNYTGTTDGKPLTEIAPTATGLTEKKNFWVDVEPDSFIPGFADQLQGANTGEKRTVTVTFPANFVTPQLAGKQAVYAVEVVEVKERVLPALDDAFAKSYGAESLELLRGGVRKDLENELNYKLDQSVRNQLIRSLMNRVNFELPESVVAMETKNVVYDLVQENARRGVTRDTIEHEKEKIYSAASSGARDRVKVAFLLSKIAQKEAISVTQEEFASRLQRLAAMSRTPLDQFVRDMEARNAMPQIHEQLINDKVLDLLQKNAQVEEVPV